MKVTKYGQSLYQLTRLWAFNCFLVKEDDGFTLIDTNMWGSANGILKAASELGAPIQRIVLTHHHNDHVASLDALHEKLPDVPVMSSARTARILTGDMSLDPDEPQKESGVGKQTTKTKVTQQLREGDRVGSLEVVFSPGHAPGHLSLLDTRDGTLIAGDAFQTQGGIAVAGQIRWRFPLPSLFVWHKPSCLASAKKLRALNPSRLAVGHGDPLDNPAAEMDRAIEEYR